MSALAGIYRAIAEERARLERRELEASARLAAAYRIALESLAPLFAEISAKIAARRAAGLPVTPGWLFAQARYRQMIEEARVQARELALVTGNTMLDESDAAAQMGAAQAQELLGLSLRPDPATPTLLTTFAGINEQALATLTAELGPTSPLVGILAEFPIDAAAALRTSLVKGMALGQGADEISRGMRAALGRNLVRANLIVRTEMHRAHREATRAVFQANSSHLNGWIWMADLSPRTCPVCWAMHGTKHPLSEPMGTHPACRCVMAPWTKSFRELGIAVPDELETRLEVPTGEALFAGLQPWQQRAILGPSGFALYRTGTVQLSDFVQVSHSAQWGTTRSERSVRAIAQAKGIPVPSRSFAQSIGGPSAGGSGGASSGPPTPPAVTPVSSRISIPHLPEFEGSRAALATIDVIHMDGMIPQTEVLFNASMSGGTQGAWSPAEDRIYLNRQAINQALTIIHEVGHVLDGSLGRTITAPHTMRLASFTDPAFRDWRLAAGQSQSVTDLIARNDAYLALTGQLNPDLTYVLELEEIWARSYTQFIVRRSGNPRLETDFQQRRSDFVARVGYDLQWDDADFAPIEHAIEDLFRAKRWMP